MFVVLLLILVIVAVVGQLSKSKKRTWIGRKTTRLILFGYGGLLVLLAAASVLLPINSSSLKVMSEEEIKDTMDLHDSIMQKAFRGTFDEKSGLHAVREWTFPINNEELMITPVNAYAQVFIENSPDLSSEIQVTHFVGNTVVNGYDITDQRSPMNIDMNGNELRIRNPHQVVVKLAEFSPGFPYQQFSEEKVELFENHSFGSIGIDILYIKAPEGLKVEGQALYVN